MIITTVVLRNNITNGIDMVIRNRKHDVRRTRTDLQVLGEVRDIDDNKGNMTRVKSKRTCWVFLSLWWLLDG